MMTMTVAVALAMATMVTCVTAAPMTPLQDDCCAHMVQGCDSMGADPGCCPTKAPSLDAQLGPSARVAVAAPHLTDYIVLTVPTVVATVLARPGRVLAETSPPTARGVPHYLLLATFRI